MFEPTEREGICSKETTERESTLTTSGTKEIQISVPSPAHMTRVFAERSWLIQDQIKACGFNRTAMIRMTGTFDIEEEDEDGDEPQRETAYMESQPNVKFVQGRTS